MNKQFLLDQDLIENRQFQLIVDDKIIKQENRTNPKITRLGTQRKLEFSAITETVPDYEVRVVLDTSMTFDIESKYQIRFDSDLIKTYKCVGIEPSREEGLYVKIILCLDNQVT